MKWKVKKLYTTVAAWSEKIKNGDSLKIFTNIIIYLSMSREIFNILLVHASIEKEWWWKRKYLQLIFTFKILLLLLHVFLWTFHQFSFKLFPFSSSRHPSNCRFHAQTMENKTSTEIDILSSSSASQNFNIKERAWKKNQKRDEINFAHYDHYITGECSFTFSRTFKRHFRRRQPWRWKERKTNWCSLLVELCCCCCEEHEHRQDFPHFQLFPFDLKFTKSQIKVSTCKLSRFITKRILALSWSLSNKN